VYDCLDASPYYDSMREPYMNENDAIDLGPIDESG
jgi:hypothetical protein